MFKDQWGPRDHKDLLATMEPMESMGKMVLQVLMVRKDLKGLRATMALMALMGKMAHQVQTVRKDLKGLRATMALMELMEVTDMISE